MYQHENSLYISTSCRPYSAGFYNAYPENVNPARLKPLVRTHPPIEDDAMLVSKNMNERNNYNSNLELQTALRMFQELIFY